MSERKVTIVNELGLHARPAAQLVRLASQFGSRIELERDGVTVNGKSILGVMTLEAECGACLVVRAEGDDADAAIEAISQLMANGFGE